MDVEYHLDAIAQLDEWEIHAPEIYSAFDEVLELLEEHDDDPRLRRRLIRPANAFVVQVYPRGYGHTKWYLFWIPEDGQTRAFVKWVGSSDAEIG